MGKFDYSDLVCVRDDAPEGYRPGHIGSIYSIFEIKSELHAESYQMEVGMILFGVEFSDGHGIEIPQQWLDKLDD